MHWYLTWVFVAAGNVFAAIVPNSMYPAWLHLVLAAACVWLAVTEYRRERRNIS